MELELELGARGIERPKIEGLMIRRVGRLLCIVIYSGEGTLDRCMNLMSLLRLNMIPRISFNLLIKAEEMVHGSSQFPGWYCAVSPAAGN